MDRTVLAYMDSSAEKYPLKCAVTDGSVSFSYCELRSKALSLSSEICRVLPSRSPVGVYMDKCATAVCVFWAVAYAGCFYSVLNPELPARRLEQTVSVLRPGIIITDREHLEAALEIFPNCRIITAEELFSAEADACLLSRRRAGLIDTDALYVNFTSGSTGTPKGIAVAHRSVTDFIGCFTELFGISDADVIANQAPFDFDVSVKDIYSAAMTGATLAVIPRPLFSQPAALADFLCEHRATTMIWAVSALCLLTAFHALDYRVPETVNKILFSGEVMPLRSLKSLKKYLPDVMYVNLYGPTEITCNCTYHILDDAADYSGGIPIGRPFPNEDVFLLDEDNRLITAPACPGEICVRGTALALGYYSCPEQTALHFVPNPLNPHYPELIYRTGDLGKYGEQGELFFCGRKDFQIKYMGHRIELEEVERELGALDGVERCCCVFDEKKGRLKGFYTGSASPEEIHSAMAASLPAFMIPGTLKKIDSFPLTKNGKTDRKKLAEGEI